MSAAQAFLLAAPCDSCRHWAHCAETGDECEAFRRFVAKVDWASLPRLPTVALLESRLILPELPKASSQSTSVERDDDLTLRLARFQRTIRGLRRR